MMKQLTGAQIVLECLKEQGVDTVFGYPGGAILNIYDELYKQKKDFTHILTSHEQGASHAADGYARSTGNVKTVRVRSLLNHFMKRFCNQLSEFQSGWLPSGKKKLPKRLSK